VGEDPRVGLLVERREVLRQLANHIVSLHCPHPLRVAIDGIDAAGKTTLADELAPLVEARGRPVIRASLDGFHRPRTERYRQGTDSPAGYYQNSFDYEALRETLLVPLGPGGSRMYRRAVFDYRADAPLSAREERAADNAVLLFDGIFLLRPELNSCWDFRLFIAVRFDVALERALARDAPLLGSPAAVEARYRRRYFPAQELYLDTVQPQQAADIVVVNDDPAHPSLVPAAPSSPKEPNSSS
jgi:uridine kinase